MTTVLARLERPLSLSQSAAAGLAILVFGGAYCFVHTMLQGYAESPIVGAAWAMANLLPWLAAFELAKRLGLVRSPLRETGWRLSALLAAAGLASLLLEAGFGLIDADPAQLAFHGVRRLPGAALVLLLVLLLASRGEGQAATRSGANDSAPDLPLLARQIDWVKAAGNYLEFHCAAGLIMRRMTMAQAEAQLAPVGFVRIHRSTMVNADRIARIRRGKLHDEVELLDGRRLKVGTAFRSGLAVLERRLAA